MTPATRHTWFKSGLHFCGSCFITVSYWAVWLGLSALLAALLYVSLARELPVPGYVLRHIESNLDRSGLNLRFGRARFDPTGKILLQDVQLHATPYDEPLLTCRLLYIRHNLWSLLAGWSVPDEIHLEGAVLQLPAMHAASGTAEPVVRDLAVTLRRVDQVWQVSQFAGRLGPLAVTLHGDFTLPRRIGPAAAPDLRLLTTAFLRLARTLAPITDRLGAFDEPALSGRLETNPDGTNRITLLFTATAAHQPWDQPLELGALVAGTTLQLDRSRSQQVPIEVAAARVEGPAGLAATHLRAVIETVFPAADAPPRPAQLRLAATSLDTPDGLISGPVLEADLSRWPTLSLDLVAGVDGEFIAAGIEADLAAKAARVHLAGRARPDTINRVLEHHTPRAAPFFHFTDPVAAEGIAVLAPGWHFERLDAWANAGGLDSRGVPITSARGRITIVGTSFLAHAARVTLGDNRARGSYWMDFKTTDYRMLLSGALRPAAISGWFNGDWWPQFWHRSFAFPGRPPEAEVDVQGRWKDPVRSHSFVRARARDATIWGGDFETVDATVFVRPWFTDGLALDGRRARGTEYLQGTFRRYGVPGTRETARFAFDLTTNADPIVLGRMLEGRADEVLASLAFTRPPVIHAWGEILGGTPDYRFTGTTDAPLHYYGFPLERVTAQGRVLGPEVQLDDIHFGAGGGEGTAKATLNGPPEARRLGFDVFLNHANLARTVRAVQEYDANRTGTPVPAAESKFVRQAANSRLDAALSATGDPADINSFKGAGNAALTGAELGEINLFGLLSQVLSGLSLSFSSLKLDAAHSSFDLEHGELRFPNFKVTGPSAVIDGRGKYTFATNGLDFAARFRPYEAPGSLLAAAFSLVLNPLTSILELKLTGQLADPKWSVVVSSGTDPSKSAPTPTLPPAKPAAPSPASVK